MQIVLAERPGTGPINDRTFRKEIVPFDLEPGPKQVLYKTHYISLDPTQRTWLNDSRGYLKPVQLNEVMRAGALGTVVRAGQGSVFKAGDTVFGLLGMLTYCPFFRLRTLKSS